MKRRPMILRLAGLAVLSAMLACGSLSAPGAGQDEIASAVAATLQAFTPPPPAATQAAQPSPAATPTTAPTDTPAAQGGIRVSFNGDSLLIPAGLAGGALGELVPAVEDQSGAPWEVAPAFIRFTFQDYALANPSHPPQISIYPAQEYAALGTGAAAESQKRLQDLLAHPAAPHTNDVLPYVPFFNAGQIFASQQQVIHFQNGAGLRVVTQYAQDVEPVNNGGLFYHFEGLTGDGKFYIVAILPVNIAFLPASSDPAAAVPADGLPFPDLNSGDGTVFDNYYQAMTVKLNGAAPADFNPDLTALDSLLQSVSVGP